LPALGRQQVDLIFTTPEKFDSITRRRKDRGSMSFFSEIALLLIDEVHLLNSNRGGTLEAVVSRLRLLSGLPAMHDVGIPTQSRLSMHSRYVSCARYITCPRLFAELHLRAVTDSARANPLRGCQRHHTGACRSLRPRAAPCRMLLSVDGLVRTVTVVHGPHAMSQNLTDLAAWLSVPPGATKAYGEEMRPVTLKVRSRLLRFEYLRGVWEVK